MRVSLTVGLLIAVAAWGCAPVREAARVADVAPEVPSSSGGPYVTLKLASDQFCAFYREVMARPEAETAVALARRIGGANLSKMEKNWLLFSLVDFEHELLKVLQVASGGQGYGLDGPENGGFRLGATDLGMVIVTWRDLRADPPGSGAWFLHRIELPLMKSEEFPLGTTSLGGRADSALAPAEAARTQSPEVSEGPGAEFCRLYREALYAEEDSEKLALALRAEDRDLSDHEKAYLRFTLLEPGMSEGLAHEISGGDRLYSSPFELNKVNHRWYSNLLRVSVSDAQPQVVNSVSLPLAKMPAAPANLSVVESE